MKVAILSGKGGTGKTTVSVNLFSFMDDVTLLDADVEEPNDHLFLSGSKINSISYHKDYPIINPDLCTNCGLCGDVCHFNAIIPTKLTVLVFEDLCHDCGFCKLVCPGGAITYAPTQIGVVDQYRISQNRELIMGTLDVGEVSGVALIDGLKAQEIHTKDIIIDCPPGVSCSTMAAIQDVDYAIIVAEPTPFGVSDMGLVVELLQNEQIPFGVIINKSGLGNDDIYTFLIAKNIPILAEIPFSKERAKGYSNGDILIHKDTALKDIMAQVSKQLEVIRNGA